MLGEGGIAIIPTAPERQRNRDSDFLFRHDSYFYYLTGFTEPGACLVITADGRSTLFCQPKDLEREIWDGYRLGPVAAPAALAVDAAHSISELDAKLPRLLENSGIGSSYQLDLIRGSHLILGRPCPQAYLLEVPGERRIIFVLPWKGKTLVGTTEVRQTLGSPIRCSDEERAYMLQVFRHYFPKTCLDEVEIEDFAGLRPLIRSAADPSQATREYALQREGNLISVFGGKWTTSHALARKLSSQIQ